ncbi:MAG: glycosyltransferase [Pseudomonadota bacterium]|nr:glycosyltransferase [Pseudomonadota bacterium]
MSVVIPSYNRADRLRAALESVAEQTLKPSEVIVVDDGSSDGTAALLRYVFPNVRYLYRRHRGVSAARNEGIRAAGADWIALLDSDDTWKSSKLERQAEALAQAPRCRLIHCDEIWMRNGRPFAQKTKHRKNGGWIFERCLHMCAISPSSALLHRSVFDNIGWFDESLPACEDYDLWLRLTAREPVLFVPEALVVKHGGHGDQLSRRMPALDRFRIKALVKLIDSGTLTGIQREAALGTLTKKLDIYITGARKRGRDVDASRYESIRCRLCPR